MEAATKRHYRTPKVRNLYDTAVLSHLEEALTASGLSQDVNDEILGLVEDAMDAAKRPWSMRLI